MFALDGIIRRHRTAANEIDARDLIEHAAFENRARHFEATRLPAGHKIARGDLGRSACSLTIRRPDGTTYTITSR